MRTRRYLLLIATFSIVLCSPAFAQHKSSSTHSGTHTSSTKNDPDKTVHVRSYTKKNGTVVRSYDRKPAGAKTEAGGVHTTAGSGSTALRDSNGKIKRSEAAKKEFERETGYPDGRPGYVVDHIKPLACGGADDPSNMQWQTMEEAKAKDKTERVGCR